LSLRLPLAALSATVLLAACEPPPPATTVSVGDDASVTTTTPADVTVIPGSTGTAVGVSPSATAGTVTASSM
jgi:hypothetical protein